MSDHDAHKWGNTAEPLGKIENNPVRARKFHGDPDENWESRDHLWTSELQQRPIDPWDDDDPATVSSQQPQKSGAPYSLAPETDADTSHLDTRLHIAQADIVADGSKKSESNDSIRQTELTISSEFWGLHCDLTLVADELISDCGEDEDVSASQVLISDFFGLRCELLADDLGATDEAILDNDSYDIGADKASYPSVSADRSPAETQHEFLEKSPKWDGTASDLATEGFDDVESEYLEYTSDEFSAGLELGAYQEGLDTDTDLPEYDEAAQQDLWRTWSEVEESFINVARARASEIAQLLECRSSHEQAYCLVWLEELFMEFRSSATFRAIKSATENGLSPETLNAMVELRQIWMERSEWWKRRYWLEREGYVIAPADRRASMLSWRLAQRIVLARLTYPPEAMIDDQWLDDWLRLTPSQAGFFSFSSYLDYRLNTMDAALMDEGFHVDTLGNGFSEFADKTLWYRALPQEWLTVAFCGQPSLPFEHGRIGVMENDDDD